MATTSTQISKLRPSAAIYGKPKRFSQGNRRVRMFCVQQPSVSLSIKCFSGLRGHNSVDFLNRSQSCYFEIPTSKSRRRERCSRMVPKAMFARFTEKAIKVVMLAQEEARRLGHNFVGTEQILLGLTGEGTGIAATVLKSMGITLTVARVEVEKIIGRGSGFVSVEIPFTPRAQRVLDFSLEEAKKKLGHKYYVGTEHLLLGILRDLREGEGVAARVLDNLGVDPSDIHTQVIKKVSGLDNEVIDSFFVDPLSQVSTDKQRKFRGGSLRSCTKVHKQGTALGRSVDLAKFNGYDELIDELDQMFEFNGELEERNKKWLIVYTDDEGDMMLVGDDPWEEFCSVVRKIYIYAREEVQ